jgi:hypothetical protein
MYYKRGQGGLSMNTIIIAIIGIIVLLLIVTFFTGGMSTVFNRIRGVFSGGTAGYDVDLAKANCQAYCARAKLLDRDQWRDSTFCTQSFDIGGEDGSTTPTRCSDSPLNLRCVTDGNVQITC